MTDSERNSDPPHGSAPPHGSHEPGGQRGHHSHEPSDPSEGDGTGDRALETVPPFTGARLERELNRDVALRWGMVAVAVVVFLVVTAAGAGTMATTVVALGLIVAAWLLLNVNSARISRDLPELTPMIESQPAYAEDRLARHLRAKPLMTWVRLMLYHRLAGLRHRQRRFEESLAIAAAVLQRQRRLGPAREARAHLLLMLAEAAMERRDLISAYHALLQLHYTRLSLVEALQRLALQTRYEVMCGYHQRALHRRDQKVQLAELMPAAQCGAVHAILATAATHTRQEGLAHWLWRRAELLCTAEQLSELKTGGFSIGIVDSARPHETTH